MQTITKAVLGLTLGATALTAAAPADAQRYRHRHRDNTGTAVVAGIAGIAIGAALASSSRRDRYYDRYDRRYYNYDRNYYDYDRPYYRDRGYYPRDGYYYSHYEQRGWRGCSVRRVYDPYLGRRVNVRYCR